MQIAAAKTGLQTKKKGMVFLNYKEFKQEVITQIKVQLGEKFLVEIHEVPKNNGLIKEGIIIRSETKNISPTFYLKEHYALYESGQTISQIARGILKSYHEMDLSKWNVEQFTELHEARSHICYKLVNYEKNKKLLEDVPYVPVMDLAVVFYYRAEHQENGPATVLIHEKHRKDWGLTVAQLYKIAKDNMVKILPPQFLMMSDIVREAIPPEELQADFPENMDAEYDDMNRTMYILTNDERYLGASCILYPDILERIAYRLDSNLIILPSSIHECIIMPDSGRFTIKTLQELVVEMNQNFLHPEEMLSDEVYYYQRKTKVLKMGENE